MGHCWTREVQVVFNLVLYSSCIVPSGEFIKQQGETVYVVRRVSLGNLAWEEEVHTPTQIIY